MCEACFENHIGTITITVTIIKLLLFMKERLAEKKTDEASTTIQVL